MNYLCGELNMMKNEAIAVSIVVPSFNRPKQAMNCVKLLLAQDFYGHYEVILVDDGSELDYRRYFQAIEKMNEKLRVIRQENFGAASARNHGINCAIYPLVAFTDDDCLPSKTWLSEITAPFQEHDILGHGGIMYCPAEKQSLMTHAPPPLEIARISQAAFPGTNNVCYKKDALTAAGCFDERFPAASAEDVDLFIRVSRHGLVIFDRDLAMEHTAEKVSLKVKLKKYFAFYAGFGILRSIYPEESSQIYKTNNTISHLYRSQMRYGFFINKMMKSSLLEIISFLIYVPISRLGILMINYKKGGI